MSKQVKMAKGKEFTFAPTGGGVSKYPWEQWFNGDLLLLEQDAVNEAGETVHKRDYEVATDAMPPKIKTAARRRYKVVQISRKDADGHKLGEAIIIKARDMTPEERTTEDLLRAEEKEAAKARREAEQSVPMQQQATA